MVQHPSNPPGGTAARRSGAECLGAGPGRQAWGGPGLVGRIQESGGLDEGELLRAFSAGVGVIVAVAPEDAAEVSQQLAESWVIGEVTRGDGVTWR